MARQNEQAHGQVCYLQIPAADPMKSADFYERVFGWRIERPYASFESPGLIGQWTNDRPAAAQSGPLIWINVTDLGSTLSLATAAGGEIVSQPSSDDSRLVATVRDPGGNEIGIVQHGRS